MNKVGHKLIAWYHKQNFDMPWRGTEDVYKIWISEIMLQQTQVKTVIKYYNNWVKSFPTINAVAKSDDQKILRIWEGLGYYQRAHNIHETSQTIVNQHNSKFPKEFNELIKLKGIGDYTASAIMSIAYNKPYPAIDGNIKRVVARLQGVTNFKEIIKLSKKHVLKIMDYHNPSEINQALMDLGREICVSKAPKCYKCPLKSICVARKTQSIEKYSIKANYSKKPIHDVIVGMIWKNNKILISKRKKEGLLGGLWELPGGKKNNQENHFECLTREIYEELNIKVKINNNIGLIKHHYSHFGINMTGYHCDYKSGSPKAITSDEIKWIALDEIKRHPFPKATLKLFLLAGY